MIKTVVKSLLWSCPVALLIAVMKSYDMALKLQNYSPYMYESLYDLDLKCQLILFCVSLVVLSIPVFLALRSNMKEKGLIIVLDMASVLPFGVLFYIISLLGASAGFMKYLTKKQKIEHIKSEIVNNEKYLDLKKMERLKYLVRLKDQTITEITKQHRVIEIEKNKMRDMPADVAKYVKRKNTKEQEQNISKLESKITAIDELMKSETSKHKEKPFVSTSYIDDD